MGYCKRGRLTGNDGISPVATATTPIPRLIPVLKERIKKRTRFNGFRQSFDTGGGKPSTILHESENLVALPSCAVASETILVIVISKIIDRLSQEQLCRTKRTLSEITRKK
jgi:hypothetical protein